MDAETRARDLLENYPLDGEPAEMRGYHYAAVMAFKDCEREAREDALRDACSAQCSRCAEGVRLLQYDGTWLHEHGGEHSICLSGQLQPLIAQEGGESGGR